jgi:hypothetical protein
MSRFLPVLACGILLTAATAADKPAGVPDGYKLVYAQDFAKGEAIKDFAFPDPAAWRMAQMDGKRFLEQHKNADYKPPHRSPTNFGLIAGTKVGDFVLDVEAQQTSKEYGHRDMVFVFGYQGPAKYYYAHIATKGDDNANQIFIVNDAPRTKITKTGNAGNDWGGPDVWKTVRVERKLADGTIKVYFDDLAKPIMQAQDKTFGAGWVGFGTFDDTCRVRSVKVYAPTAEKTRDGPPFAKK